MAMRCSVAIEVVAIAKKRTGSCEETAQGDPKVERSRWRRFGSDYFVLTRGNRQVPAVNAVVGFGCGYCPRLGRIESELTTRLD